MRILITGFSTRAIAESAVQSGHTIVSLDYFGDRDQRMLVENYALQRDFALPFSAEALLQASRRLRRDCSHRLRRDCSQRLDFDAVAYVSNLENYPHLVEELAQERVLLGNTPDTLRQVRDWRLLREFCTTSAIPCPTTLLAGEEASAEPEARWLSKPLRSGGGHGIRYWSGEALDRAHVLQRYIAGRPASAAFVCDGKRSVVIGLTEQLIGQQALGARGFVWCGNMLPLGMDRSRGIALLTAVQQMADQLTRRFGLRGMNGMDVVVADGAENSLRPFLVEVNPRYTASMELVEWAYGLNVFSLHLAAMEGRLPAFSLADRLRGPYFGKGIVYARRAATMPETATWMEKDRRDIPYPGERIEAGHPICTVLAQAKTREACWLLLQERAKAVWQEIDQGVGEQHLHPTKARTERGTDACGSQPMARRSSSRTREGHRRQPA